MRVLFATDGSDGAEAAGRLVAGLPLGSESTVTVLHILTITAPERYEVADDVLDEAMEALSSLPMTVEKQLRRGHAAAEIVHAAEEHPTDLIVLGSHGYSAVTRFLLGSVAERVVRHAPCPVLLVRGTGAPIQRVVLGVDRSEGATRAAGWLREFPLPADCEVRLVTMLPNLREIAHEHVLIQPPLAEHTMPLDQWQREQASTHLQEVAAAFHDAGKQTVTEIRSADAAPGLIDVATDEGADLIVVGSHGGGALERFLLGSVSQQVLTHAPCSVLVVRGPAS